MKIAFHQVGRDKLSWEAEISTVTFEDMMAALRKAPRRALMSQDIEFETYAPDATGLIHGHVIVGGFRSVGAFTITPDASAPTAA